MNVLTPGYKRYALVALTAVYTLNLVDRGLMMLLLQPIKADLQLSDTQLGFITGIAFGLFYATLGRNGGGSDIAMISRTSSLSKTQASMIFVGISALHTFRISRNQRYADFFYRPSANGTMRLGVEITPSEP